MEKGTTTWILASAVNVGISGLPSLIKNAIESVSVLLTV
jgi:hypothetical protein